MRHDRDNLRRVVRRETDGAGLAPALRQRSPAPTSEFRERAWRVFQAALDRYLAARRERVS